MKNNPNRPALETGDFIIVNTGAAEFAATVLRIAYVGTKKIAVIKRPKMQEFLLPANWTYEITNLDTRKEVK